MSVDMLKVIILSVLCWVSCAECFMLSTVLLSVTRPSPPLPALPVPPPPVVDKEIIIMTMWPGVSFHPSPLSHPVKANPFTTMIRSRRIRNGSFSLRRPIKRRRRRSGIGSKWWRDPARRTRRIRTDRCPEIFIRRWRGVNVIELCIRHCHAGQGG
jgi:hypothetical protein